MNGFVRQAGMLVAAAAGALLFACSDPGPEALLAQARDAHERRDYKAAELHLKALLQEHPETIEARKLLAQLSAETGDFATAERELRRLYEAGTERDWAAPLLAQALLELGQPDKIIKELRPEGLQDPAAKASLNVYRARAHLFLQKPEQAQAALDIALRAQPKLPAALVTKAQLAAMANRLDEALALLADALRSDPANVEALLLRGAIERVQGRTAEAVKSYEAAVAAAPMIPKPRVELAELLIGTERYAEVKAHADALRGTPAGATHAIIMDGQLALREGNHESARNTALAVLNAAPEHLPALRLHAAAELALGNLGPAEATLQKVVRLAPHDARPRRLLATVLLRQGSAEAAAELLKPVLQSADPDTLFVAGEAALQAGELDEAQRLLARAAAARPNDVRARLALAGSHAAAGNTAAAAAVLEKLGAEQREQHLSDVMLVMLHLRARAWDKAQSALAGLEAKQPRNPLTHDLRGTLLGRKGDARGARAAFEQALALEPRYSPAAMNLVRLDLGEGMAEQARARLEAFLAANPSNEDALLGLAELKARMGAPRAEVEPLLQQARADNPRSLRPRLALTRWHLDGGDVRKAVEAAQEAHWAYPSHPEASGLLAEAQLRAGEVAQALTTLRKAAKLHERVPALHFALARAQIAANDPAGARKSLQQVLALDPAHLGAQLTAIEVEARANRPDEAIRLARAFQKTHPARVEGYALEGDVYAAQKKHAEAAGAYRMALDAGAGGLVAIRYHSALSAANDSTAADAFHADWLKAHPKDTIFRTYAAQRAAVHKDYAQAKRMLLELIALQGETAPVLNNLAWVEHMTKDPRALERAEKAYKLAPNDPQVLDTLGVIRLERGELEAAAPLLARARALAPEVPAIRLHHAAALVKLGRREEARIELHELLAIEKPFPERGEVQKLLATL